MRGRVNCCSSSLCSTRDGRGSVVEPQRSDIPVPTSSLCPPLSGSKSPAPCEFQTPLCRTHTHHMIQSLSFCSVLFHSHPIPPHSIPTSPRNPYRSPLTLLKGVNHPCTLSLPRNPSANPNPNPKEPKTHLCLCLGFLLQII